MRLLPASKKILRALEICPWVPIDVLVPLVAARRRVTVYKALARLRRAELVDMQRVRLGPVIGDRPLGLWALTERRREALRASDTSSTELDLAVMANSPIGLASRRSRTFVNDPVRVAAARGLAAILAVESAHGRPMEVAAWESPWVWECTNRDKSVIRLPAGALVCSVRASGVRSAKPVLVLPDLGTAPVVRWREMLRRLIERLAEGGVPNNRCLPTLIIATTNIDGRGARALAWMQFVERHCSNHAGLRLQTTLLEWQQVNTLLGTCLQQAPPHARKTNVEQHRSGRVRRRPAAACERRRCKPDGYGCYRRGGTRYRFLLEFDRGTERANQYAVKLAAYYAYRDSGQAARDYAGFPDVLFVTTTSAAETRILAAAERAYTRFAGRPLPVFTTTTERILSTPYGILGPIWRSPGRRIDSHCQYWIPCAVPRPWSAVRFADRLWVD